MRTETIPLELSGSTAQRKTRLILKLLYLFRRLDSRRTPKPSVTRPKDYLPYAKERWRRRG